MTAHRSPRVPLLIVPVLSSLCFATAARADEPVSLRQTWSGPVNFFATGAPLAIDGPDSGTNVELYNQPATATISASEIPEGAALRSAFLYWAGSISNSDCADPGLIDDEVIFTPPGGTPTAVTATQCFCSEAGAQSYDMQACRANILPLIGEIEGDYTVDEFSALIANSSTNNASFSVVVVYVAPGLPPRRVGLYDGLQTMYTNSQTLTLDQIEVDNPPAANLTWYVSEGDEGGTGTEQVVAQGNPSGGNLVLSDALNPATNPMNHTINTTTPTQLDSIGVDIDRMDISSALAFGDTSVDVTYEAGTDKFWINYNVVGIDVFEPVFVSGSTKEWALVGDSAQDGVVSPGDTVRYTVRLENTGTAPGVVTMTDPLPVEVASWTMVNTGGGTDASTGNTVVVEDLTVAAATSVEVVFDVVIAQVPDQTAMVNIAEYDATPEGSIGSINAATVLIRTDTDGDGVFDDDDNCVDVPNPSQADADLDMIGDACDPDSGTGTSGDDDGTMDSSGGADADSGDGSADGGGGTGGDSGTATSGADAGDGSASGTGSGVDSIGLADGGVDGCGCDARRNSSDSAQIALLLFLGAGWHRRRRR